MSGHSPFEDSDFGQPIYDYFFHMDEISIDLSPNRRENKIPRKKKSLWHRRRLRVGQGTFGPPTKFIRGPGPLIIPRDVRHI